MCLLRFIFIFCLFPHFLYEEEITKSRKSPYFLYIILHEYSDVYYAINSTMTIVPDVKRKLEKLTGLWEEVQSATRNRGRSLDEALEIAARFWSELQGVMATLADLEASLASQQPPAVRPQAIQHQRQVLQEIK